MPGDKRSKDEITEELRNEWKGLREHISKGHDHMENIKTLIKELNESHGYNMDVPDNDSDTSDFKVTEDLE